MRAALILLQFADFHLTFQRLCACSLLFLVRLNCLPYEAAVVLLDLLLIFLQREDDLAGLVNHEPKGRKAKPEEEACKGPHHHPDIVLELEFLAFRGWASKAPAKKDRDFFRVECCRLRLACSHENPI